jgi:predicted nucleotidyltransferase component of viral defense system
VTSASVETGRTRYFALQRLARQQGRDTQELLTLYALEGLLARLAASDHREQLVIKGGMLLAAFAQRRPTRDLDLHAQQLESDVDTVRDLIADVAALDLDDGLDFDTSGATAQVIREDDQYSGVRVTLTVDLHTAKLSVKVDVNVGDPIWPAPEYVALPRLLTDESLILRGYPLHMVLAEKLVTAIDRGTANTRWRDFADIYLLSRHLPVAGSDLVEATLRVAD